MQVLPEYLRPKDAAKLVGVSQAHLERLLAGDDRRVAEGLRRLGPPSFKPAQVRFTTALPKTRSAKVLRRAIRAVVTGDPPGDLSGLEDPASLDAIAHAT